jgi:hypothetical protein
VTVRSERVDLPLAHTLPSSASPITASPNPTSCSATAPDDPRYFSERLGAARNELVRVWKLRSAHLQPDFRSTDIIGALMLASPDIQPEAIEARKSKFVCQASFVAGKYFSAVQYL